MTTQEGNSAFYNNVADAIAKEVFHCTPQLFYVNHNKSKLPPYPYSSCVLIKFHEKHFLVSAAHNFHEEDLESIGIMIERDFYTIGGILEYWEPNTEDHYPNNLDIAIFKLDEITISAFKKRYQFLDWQKVGFNHYTTLNSRYLIYGYPGSKTKKHAPTKTITPTSLTIRTIGVQESYYLENSIDADKFLVLSVPQYQVSSLNSNSLTNLPALGGISGCGIWNVINLSIENPQYELVSIVTGEDSAKTIIHSTKMYVLYSIFENF